MSAEQIVAPVNKGPRFGVRHIQTLLLFLDAFVALTSRLNVSVALVAMTNAASTNPDFQEFDWTEKQKSYIMSSFYLGYVVNQFPGGYLSRRFGTKIVMFVCTFGSAVFSAFTPVFVTWGGWQIFCVIRVLQGLVQGAIFPSIHEHISKWSPPDERTQMGTIVYTGTDCGGVVAMLVTGLIASSPLGWPGISYVSAGICFAWCLLWLILSADNPTTSRFITKEECQYIETSLKRDEDFHKNKIPVPYFSIFTSIPVIALIFTRCCDSWGFTTIQTQIPSYLNGILNMDITNNAIFSAIPYIARWIMSYIYLFFGNMALRKGWLTLTALRKTANTIGFWLPAAFLMGIGFLNEANEWVAIALMTLSVGFNGGVTMGSLLNALDLSPNHAGVVMGIINPMANFMPVLTPLVAGALVTDVHDRNQWQLVFTFAAVAFFVGNLAYIFFSSTETQPFDAPDFLLKNNVEDPIEVARKGTLKELVASGDREEQFKGWPAKNMDNMHSNTNHTEDEVEKGGELKY